MNFCNIRKWKEILSLHFLQQQEGPAIEPHGSFPWFCHCGDLKSDLSHTCIHGYEIHSGFRQACTQEQAETEYFLFFNGFAYMATSALMQSTWLMHFEGHITKLF